MSAQTLSHQPVLSVHGVAKQFVMHLRGGLTIPVVEGVRFQVEAGECVVLGGPSGAGKSSLLKMVYGNYRVDAGSINIATMNGSVDLATAAPRAILALRRHTMGYVSQFLRAVPRVSALDVVAEAGVAHGQSRADARRKAGEALHRLNVPERLWELPPATFSGGEQQRVNIARGFLVDVPLLLLDEPTASLDAKNRAVVVEIIKEKKARGIAILGIFHDEDVRDAVADRVLDVTLFSKPASIGTAA
jgi:alpha-D-ribose 1-methylphosphonate 5-triphosphate synthase subunit PhnL